VGRKLRLRDKHRTLGQVVDDPSDFFLIVREHGDALTQYVREDIREDFVKAVELVQQLRSPKLLRTTMPVPHVECTVLQFSVRSISFKKYVVKEIGYEDWYYEYLHITSTNDEIYRVRLDSTYALFILDDLSDYVLKLFENIHNEMESTKRHNEPILEKLDSVVAPYRLARKMHE